MRLLHIINSLNTGGAEKLILDTLPLFAQKGIEVDLLLLMKTEGPFLKKLKKEKCCKIFEFDYKNVYNPWMIFRIRKIITNYDIVHVHLFPALYWTALAYFFSRPKCKLVFTEHNTTNKRMKMKIFRFIEKWIYKRYHMIITISSEVENNLKNHLGKSYYNYTLIHNGINIHEINLAKGHSVDHFFSNDSKILIQISSFRLQKDQTTLIKSLKFLPFKFKLLLVGDGPLLDDNQKLVKELGLENRVLFLGIRMDVPQLLKSADIVVLSSHHEGLSLSSIEAMASGKPFVASDVPGLREIVNGAGILFPEGNEKKLASLIIELLEKPKYYQEVANRCVNRAKDYDTSFMVEKTINLYNKLIE